MIQEKDLKQLSQLDRIEYRQRRENAVITSNLFGQTLILFFLGFIFLFCLDVLTKGMILLSSFILFSELCLGLMIFSSILDWIVFPWISYDRLKKLNEEYFDFRTEVKRKKK